MDEKNHNRPATLADLNAVEERLAERIDHFETTLRTKFEKWGHTFEVLEQRISAPERRKP